MCVWLWLRRFLPGLHVSCTILAVCSVLVVLTVAGGSGFLVGWARGRWRVGVWWGCGGGGAVP